MAETAIIEVEGETPLAQCEQQAEQKDEFVTQLSKKSISASITARN
jgi:hypothetical protein